MRGLRGSNGGTVARIEAALGSADAVAGALGDIDVPADIASWLGRLHTLVGVPFGYLVPDDAMLPPESIRFFRLDDNWARALLDGAFSIGRDLTAGADAPTTNVDRAVFETLVGEARAAAPVRQRSLPEAVAPLTAAEHLGDDDPVAWTGFLLRSRVVTEYPGLGVNVYPKGGEPGPGKIATLLPVRRLDRLGPAADTLLCLVEGDAARVDVHEAPELLHYGIDAYTPPSTPGAEPTADKEFRTFTRTSEGAATLAEKPTPVPVGGAFRARSPRVVSATRLAAALQGANGTGAPALDSAQMGFAMTQGVGMVSFERKDG